MVDYREQRYKQLIKEGFLEEEALYYSRFKISTSGMRKLRRLRKREVKNASRYGITGTTLTDYILDSYEAQGYTYEGKPSVDIFAQKVNDELMKPYKERKPVLITPERYREYKQASTLRLSSKDRFKMMQVIPTNQWNARMRDYQTLRRYHYTAWEALYIITATDPSGKLQPLDLSHPTWQKSLVNRTEWWRHQINVGIRELKLSPQQAIVRAFKNIKDYYAQDSKRTPFDDLKDLSPSGKPKANVDYDIAIRRRQRKIAKRKTLWAR